MWNQFLRGLNFRSRKATESLCSRDNLPISFRGGSRDNLRISFRGGTRGGDIDRVHQYSRACDAISYFLYLSIISSVGLSQFLFLKFESLLVSSSFVDRLGKARAQALHGFPSSQMSIVTSPASLPSPLGYLKDLLATYTARSSSDGFSFQLGQEHV